jgi:hypothetical protein
MPRLTNGLEQVLTNLGIVGSGYKLFFYETGTTTLKTTYSDEDLTVANTNPIVLNSAGRPNVDVWGSDPSLYRMILGTPDSVVGNITTIVDADPVDNYQINNISGLNPIPTAYWGITEGTSTAYTLEEPLVDISAYSNTQTFFVDIHIACGASPTLKVKDLAAITLKKYMGDGTTTDLVADDLQIQRYLCINNGTNIVVLNPRYPENLDATTEKKGINYLPQPITIANNSTDSEHDIDFSAGNAQADDGSMVWRATAMTKQIDVAWAAGTNQGGLDTGTVANDTTYHCYAIYNPTTLASDFILTATYGSPTMPSGYTKKKWVMAVLTDGSANIIPFKQDGKFIQGGLQCYNSTVVPASYTDLTIQGIPTGIRVAVNLDIFFLDNAGNSIDFRDKETLFEYTPISASANVTYRNRITMYTNTSAEIEHKGSATPATTYIIQSQGWFIPDELY